VHATQLAGDVADRPVIVVDDMISTAATIESAVRLLLEHGAEPEVVVAATHGLLVGALRVEVCSVAPLLADSSTAC